MTMLADTVRIGRRFQKSVRVDSDLTDAHALDGYVCPASATQILTHMTAQIAETGQGAFTWTGPYGSGKSSLALVLASLLGSDDKRSALARSLIGSKQASQLQKHLGRNRIIVPVVGRRANPETVILDAVAEAAPKGRRRRPDAPAVDQIRAAAEAAPSGLLILIDEMGKFLEHVAHDGGDVYFFQQLAEEASRSRGKLLVVGVLHQAFDDYAHRLSREVRDEWLKVQGRFADIPLNIAAEEQIDLISRAIEVKGKKPIFERAAKFAAELNRVRPAGDGLAQRLSDCWPLDPAVASLLGPLSRRRFGQSQRSIFGFLNSAEPFGFQDFLKSTPDDADATYELPQLWDYLRANLEPSIMASPDGHRWALAVDALERCEARGGDAEHVAIVKTVSLIDLFKERSGLSASPALLKYSLPSIKPKRLTEALDQLAAWSIIIYKRHLGAFAIYAGSDFDIEAAVLEARGKMAGLDFAKIRSVAMLQPILAKRFYHQTGALIWFDIDVAPLANAVDTLRNYKPANGSAGLFLLLLNTQAESDSKARRTAKAAAEAAQDFPAAVGWTRDNYAIREAATELLALEAVRAGRSELNGDAVARREVDARISRAAADLEDKLRGAFANARWEASVQDADGEPIHVASENGAVTLNLLASKIANAWFDSMPVVHNELLNRIKPSSNAIAAQKALLRAMLESHREPRLGIEGFPAEGGLYAALIERAGLHAPDPENPGAFQFVKPKRNDTARLQPLWSAAEKMFRTAGSAQVSFEQIYTTWKDKPFGVRDGLLPVLGLAFVLSHLSRLSIYLDGVYQVRLTTMLVDRLTQDPSSVRLRWNEISETQRTTLAALADVVESHGGFDAGLTCPTALDTAKGLVRLVNDLPTWVLRTMSLPNAAVHVRNLAKTANDPNKFLLDDLPTFLSPSTQNDGSKVAAVVDEGLQALVTAYPKLMDDLELVMLNELRVRSRSIEALEELKSRAAVIKNLTGNYRLDALATRLATYEFANARLEPIEGIASLAAGKPSRDWVDRDVDHARIELAALAQEFVKAEGFAHVKGRADGRVNMAIYTSDWRRNAPVRAEIDISSAQNSKVAGIAAEVLALFAREGIDDDLALAVIAELGATIANGEQLPVKPGRARKIA